MATTKYTDKPAGAMQTMSSGDMLEPDYAEVYNAWKADPSPTQNARLLKTIHPAIEGAVNAHVGSTNPLLLSQARRMALDAVRNYDPRRSRLKTHLFNQLQGLKRVNRQQTAILKVPERVALDRYHLENYTKELAHELGREPSDAELLNRTGFSARRLQRLRSYNPAVAEGQMIDQETGLPTGFSGGVVDPRASDRNIWLTMVYDDLSPIDQQIMEYAFGLNGRRPRQNQEIARLLKRSPGLISQRKKAIQKLLDQEPELSPFLGD